MKPLKLWSLLLFLLFSGAASSGAIDIQRSAAGELILEVDFSEKKLHRPIYLAGSPVGEQVGLIVKGTPADFVIMDEKVVRHEMSASHYPRVEREGCRCDNLLLRPGPVPPLDEVASFELTALGDFRGVALTKITLRSVGLKGSELIRFERASYHLARVDGKTPEVFESSELILPDSLLIVTPEIFLPEVERLALVSRAEGIEVVIRTLEELGTNFWDLKRSLKALYTARAFGHILFIGDEDHLPTDLVQTSTDFQTPSDLQYFLMGPASDRFPDVSGARLAVSSAYEIDIYRRKLEAYYAEAPSGRALMVASNEGRAPSDVEYVRQMAEPFANDFGLTISEVLQEDQEAGAQLLLSELEKGSDWLNYIGHGSGYSWPSLYGPEFELSHIRSLQGGSRPFVLIDVACQNGRFGNDERLGKEFIFHEGQGQSAGAVAYYGGSVDITWHPPALMAVAINEDVARAPVSTLGEHLLRGQFELIENFDDLEAALENLVWYHLQGVPTLRPKF